MTTIDSTRATHPTTAALIAALLAADPDAVAACFTGQAKLRALLPPGLREREGAAEIGELMSSWFADCTDLELIAAADSPIADKQHISYRINAVKQGRGHCVIEQQLYVEMDADRFRDVTLVCSGFRPTT